MTRDFYLMVGMDVEVVRDVASLNPDLLQLPEVSTVVLKENPNIAEQLFSQWLALPDTVKLVVPSSSTDLLLCFS